MTRTPFSRLDALARSLFRSSLPRSPSVALEFQGSGQPPVSLGTADQRAVAAVATLLVWKLIQHGGSHLPVGPASEVAERLLASFPETDRLRLEAETTEILRWLEDSLNLLGGGWDEADERGLYPWEDREFPDDGKLELIRRAIRDGHDLQIEYFTYRRNSMSERRITPLTLEEDDRILLARCHWRREERRFAVHRIKTAVLLATQG